MNPIRSHACPRLRPASPTKAPERTRIGFLVFIDFSSFTRRYAAPKVRAVENRDGQGNSVPGNEVDQIGAVNIQILEILIEMTSLNLSLIILKRMIDIENTIIDVNRRRESKEFEVNLNTRPWIIGESGPYCANASLLGMPPSEKDIAAAKITPSW